MRTRSTLSLALCLSFAGAAGVGCNGSISDNGMPGGSATGSSTGNGGSTGSSTGNGGTGVATGTGVAGTTGAGGGSVVQAPPGSALQWQPVLRLADYEYSNSVRDLLGIQVNVTLEPDAPSTGGFRIGGPAGDNTVSVYHSA